MMVEFDFKLSGFLIGLVAVSLFATGLGLFMTNMQSEYSVTGNNSLLQYDGTAELVDNTEEIRNATTINPDDGWLDIIGGFFSAGYSALKTSWYSIGLFEDITNDAASDIEPLAQYKIGTYIYLFIILGILVGVGVSVLVKMRI